MMWFDLAAAAVNGTKHSTTHQYDNIHARVTRDAFTVTPVSHGSVSRRTELMHVSHKTPSNSGESRSLSDVVRWRRPEVTSDADRKCSWHSLPGCMTTRQHKTLVWHWRDGSSFVHRVAVASDNHTDNYYSMPWTITYYAWTITTITDNIALSLKC